MSLREVRVRPDRVGLLLGSVLLVAACGTDAPPTTPTPAPAAFVRVDIEGPPQRDLGPPGATLQLRALATFSDGSRPDVTSEAVWSVIDPRVLQVSPRGLVTGVAEGGTIVTATYRERAGVTNLRVANELGPRFQVGGVVRDAERGTPIVRALLWTTGPRPPEYVVAATDGNGFFNLGAQNGRVSFVATQFGYEDAAMTIPEVTGDITLDVRLRPNPGAYIERTLADRFDTQEEGLWASSTVHISTRAGGVFDAVGTSSNCDYNGEVTLVADSGGAHFVDSHSAFCYARLRFVAPASDVQLTIRGYKATTWELTFREPR